MQHASQQRWIDRMALKIILATLAVTALLFAWSQSHYHNNTNKPDTWLDEKSRLHVLGITLDGSTLREAETALQSRSESALYIYPEGGRDAGLRLEAYFPSIADHTRVILRLAAGEAELKAMAVRGSQPHQYPNGVLRMNLASDDLTRSQQLKVSELTLVPSLAVTPDMLSARFGKPDAIEEINEGSIRYRFDKVGLEATLQKDGPSLLHFINPIKPND